MKKIKSLISISLMLILILIFAIIYLLLPHLSISLNGNKFLIMAVGEKYVEEGANAYLIKNLQKKEIPIKIKGKVDSNKIGKYIIHYKINYNKMNSEEIRVINVVDLEKPKIELKKQVVGCKKQNLVDYDAIAIDNYDGDITNKIQSKIYNDKIMLKVVDSSNNFTILESDIKYIDNEKPIIKLNGEDKVYILKDTKYEDLGAIAYDSCDGDISDKIEIKSNVDINKPNTYEVIYTIRDIMGNENSIKRQVIVISHEEEPIELVDNGTIYLTFDDGPGPYTENLLNILDKYNIKATFFVTNQFPKHIHLIKKEYEKGHQIGIHSYTHKWSIYRSVDAFFDDFNKMENIIYEQTNIHPKIFRFPGGSSNTISKNYSRGIMTKLANILTDKGYTYFDWNIDSGDTSRNNSVKDIIKNVKSHLKGNGCYIILMHDIKKNTIDALPTIIEYIKARGYKFSVLEEDSFSYHLKIAN